MMDKTTHQVKTTKRVSSFLSHFTFHHQINNHQIKKSNNNHHSLSINSTATATSANHLNQSNQIISPSHSDLSSIISASPITPNHDIHLLQSNTTNTNTITGTTSYFQFPTHHSNKSTLTSIPIPIPTSTSTLTTQSSLSNLSASTSLLTDESQSLFSSASSRSNNNKPAFIKVLKKLNEQSTPTSSLSSSPREPKISQSNQISKSSSLTPLWESELEHFPCSKAALEGFTKYRGTLLKHTPPAQVGFWNSRSSKVWKTTLCCLTAIYPHNHPTLNSEATLYNLHIFNSPSPAQNELESARLRIEASSIVCVLENKMAGESLVLKITGKEVSKNLDTSQIIETQTSWMFAMEDVTHLKTWMKTFKEIVNELRQNSGNETTQAFYSASSTSTTINNNRPYSSMSHPSTQPADPHLRVPSRHTNINPSLLSINSSIRSVTSNFLGPTSFQSATPKPKSDTWSSSVKSQSFHQPIRTDPVLETLRPEESPYRTSPLIRSQTSVPTKSSDLGSQPSSSTSSLSSHQTSLPCPPRRSSRSVNPEAFKPRPLLSHLIIKKPSTTVVSSKTDFERNGMLSGPLVAPPTAALPPIPDEGTEKGSEETVHGS